MSIIDAALSRSRTVIAVLLFILVAGAAAYVGIPKESDPDVNLPILYVSLGLEGISPEDSERLLIRPMEKELQSIEGVKEMNATAYEGGGNIVLEFEAGFDSDAALQDVREKVDEAKPKLPAAADEPSVNEVNLSLFPILVVTLSGDVSEQTLIHLARDLQDEIEALPAVLEAPIQGDRADMVEVIIDPARLESYGLRPDVIFNTLSRSNILVAAGALENGRGRFPVKVPGLIEGVRDIMDLPLKASGDAVVRMSDVADIRRTYEDPVTFARMDGRRAVTLDVSKRIGQNIIETSRAVRDVVAEAQGSWPEGVSVSFSQDKSDQVRNMLGDLQNNVTSAILLVMIVVVAVLGIRGGILVGMAIPGSFLAGILLLYLAGMTVNIVVLFSLILAVGMLVDGAIVVTEYADRKMAEGESKRSAYGLAARRMSWPIIASTATTLAAFLPLLFWPGIVGEFMKYLPVTLIVTLSASLAMALVFIPVLGANLGAMARLFLTVGLVALGGMIGFMAGGAVTAVAGPVVGVLVSVAIVLVGVALGWFVGRAAGRALERPLARADRASLAGDSAAALDNVRGLTRWYLKLLRGALRFPSAVVAGGIAVLLLSYTAYGMFGRGVEFFPAVEPEFAILNVHARGNLSVHEIDSLVRQVEGRVLELQAERGEFKTVYTISGSAVDGDGAEDLVGKILLEFQDWDARRPAAEIQKDVEARTADLGGLHLEFREEETGPPVGKPIHVEMTSTDYAALDEAVAIVRDRVMEMDGVLNVEDSLPIPGIEWVLEVDRAQAAKFGVDVLAVGQFVQFVTKGLEISDYRPDDTDDEIGIFVRFPEDQRTVNRLDMVRIATDSGLVPLSNFVTRVAEQKTGLLRRTGGDRTMYVKADVEQGILPDEKVRELRAWMETAPLPESVSVTFKGEDEEQRAAQAFLQKAFMVALFLMAVILLTQFNSFYSAFLILFAVIMSTAGVLIGLMVIQQPFGIVMSGVGVIALAGIVVNNNIVLIDTFDRLKASIGDTQQAILLTGAQRLRPVLLTTVTTILGLMPMVLQMNIDFVSREITTGAPSTQWWVQLATAIAAGLAFSTLLTLVMTPSLLMLRANVSARRAARGDGGNRGWRVPFIGRFFGGRA